LGRPVARGASTIIFAGYHDQRHAFASVAFGRLMNWHQFATGHMARPPPLSSISHLVAYADIREGAPQHHVVVDSPSCERIEILRLDTQTLQIKAGCRVRCNGAYGRDMVRCD